MKIKAFIFDFGGVLAEEGFREGLKAIGRQNRLDPDYFFMIASKLVYDTGYITGTADETAYWDALRKKTGITGSDKELRGKILKRFILRPDMIKYVERLKASGVVTAVLSDQTNWLDDINKKTPFYQYFDHVFNSFRLKKSKKDPSVFRDVCSAMGFKPDEVVFVDDNIENIGRALNEGLNTIHFRDMKDFENKLRAYPVALLQD